MALPSLLIKDSLKFMINIASLLFTFIYKKMEVYRMRLNKALITLEIYYKL